VLPTGTDALIDLALREDIGDGDHTTLSTIPPDARGAARLLVKDQGVLAGVELAQAIAHRFDPDLHFKLFLQDGATISKGDVAFTIMGSSRSILIVERLMLTFMQRMSGIATLTHRFVQAVEGTGCRILDTRKTTPGLRVLEKYAVRCGGGVNHRMGLDDAAMLKENHLAWAGGVRAAVAAVQASAPWPARVIVEAETEQQACEAVEAGADGVLLDEFSPEALLALVPQLRQRAASRVGAAPVVLEASGVQPEQLAAYAATGIDLISTSAPVTRSRWLDLSMRFDA